MEYWIPPWLLKGFFHWILYLLDFFNQSMFYLWSSQQFGKGYNWNRKILGQKRNLPRETTWRKCTLEKDNPWNRVVQHCKKGTFEKMVALSFVFNGYVDRGGPQRGWTSCLGNRPRTSRNAACSIDFEIDFCLRKQNLYISLFILICPKKTSDN